MRMFRRVNEIIWIYAAISSVFFAGYWYTWSHDGLLAGGYLAFYVFAYAMVTVCIVLSLFTETAAAFTRIKLLINLPEILRKEYFGEEASFYVPAKMIIEYGDNKALQILIAHICGDILKDRQWSLESLIIHLYKANVSEEIIEILRKQLSVDFETIIEQRCVGLLSNGRTFPEEDELIVKDFFEALNRALILGSWRNWNAVGISLASYLKNHLPQDMDLNDFVWKIACRYAPRLEKDEMQNFFDAVGVGISNAKEDKSSINNCLTDGIETAE